MTTLPAERPEHPLRFPAMILTAVALVLIVIVLLHGISSRNDALRRRAALLSDLDRLAEAQEDAMARDGRYAAHLEREGGGADTARFGPSPDIKVRFDRLGDASWRVVVTDTVLVSGPRNCGLFKGEAGASPHRAVVLPGVPACW